MAKQRTPSPAPESNALPIADQDSIAVMRSANGHYDGMRLLEALKTLKKGDFNIRLPIGESVVGAAIAEAFNDVADLLEDGPRDRPDRECRRQGGADHPTCQCRARDRRVGRPNRFLNGLIGDLVRPD